MRLRRLLPAAIAALLLIGCAPEQMSPGGGSPAAEPTDMATPMTTDAPTSAPATSPADPGDRYDY